MAIAPEQKNPLQIIRDWRNKVKARTNVTNFSTDSKTRALLDVTADEVVQARREALESYYAQKLSKASGQQLNRIGNDMGMPRLGSRFAQAHAREQNFAFYVESGVFGDINSGADITVPAGTIVYSDANDNELGSTINYKLTEAVTLSAAGTIGFFSAKATEAGTAYNVSGATIKNHAFTGYTASSANSLKVLNFFAVINGREQESDDRYRYRLSKHYDTLVSRNVAWVTLNALQVPGVLDVMVEPGYFGIGTAGVIVLGPDYETNTNIINAVQAQLQTMSVPGLRAVAVGATRVQLDFELNLKLSQSLTLAQRNRLEADVRRVMRNHIRSVAIGGTFSLDDLQRILFKETRKVIAFGKRGSAQLSDMYKNIYVRRGAAHGFASEKERVIANEMSLQNDEFLDLGSVTFSYT